MNNVVYVLGAIPREDGLAYPLPFKGWCGPSAFRVAALSCALGAVGGPAIAQEWSLTELHFQYGTLAVPLFATAGETGVFQDTPILTLKHASAWPFGDVFFFIDAFDAISNEEYPYADKDAYAEYYITFSSSKLLGVDYGSGPLRDLGLILGLNAGYDPKLVKYTPGVSLAWNVPGFAFLNTAFMAYIDDSAGVSGGGAPAETDTYFIDVNWAYPFVLGRQKFSIEGHFGYVGERENEFGQEVSGMLLAQPQFRWDLGNALFERPDKLFVGTEIQWFVNKLGDPGTDELAAQALVVWRF